LIIDNNNNIEGEKTMNDQVKVESVEKTVTQTNTGVNEVSESTENKVFTAEQLENIVRRNFSQCS